MPAQPPEPSDGALPLWAVWRIDDTGNTFLVENRLRQQDAERLVALFSARGHKQTYWAEPETAGNHGAASVPEPAR